MMRVLAGLLLLSFSVGLFLFGAGRSRDMALSISSAMELGQWWLWGLIPAWFVASGGLIRLWQHRTRAARIAHGPTVWLLPRADLKPVDPAKVRLWARMGDVLPRGEWISWEVGGHQDDVRFALHASETALEQALIQVRAEWPGTHRRAAEPDPAHVPEGWHVYWVEVAPRDQDRSIESAGDVVRALLLEVSSLDRGRGWVQVLARPDRKTPRRLLRRAIQVRDQTSGSQGIRAIKTAEARALEKRAQEPFWWVTVRCVGIAPHAPSARAIAHRLARALIAGFTGNPLRVVRKGRGSRPVVGRRMGRGGPWAASELAYLAHLMGRDAQALAPRLRTAPARSLPAAPEMRVPRQARIATIS